jgi:glycosyltransferase involved in cell wall biosynthesis
MRVLYFTEKDSPHDQRFLSALANSGHEGFALRQVMCQTETPEKITEVTWPAGQPDWSDWAGCKLGVTQFRQIIEKIHPDLVHAGPVQGPAYIAALSGFNPLVTMSWGSDLLVTAKRSPLMHCITQFTLDHSDLFFGDCQTVIHEALSYGFPEEKIVSFPWGVDLAFFSPANGTAAGKQLRQSLGWRNRFVILCNRSWSPIYGVDVLARAFVEASQQNQALRLLLVGEGPLVEQILDILKPVRDKVYFPGRLQRSELPGAYCAADLFVSPSHSDGSSISLLEALACGLPVLVSDIPSNREWVMPGKVGDWFRDGDIQSLVKKLLELADSNDKLRSYALMARILAEQKADWKVSVHKLLQGYQLVVN